MKLVCAAYTAAFACLASLAGQGAAAAEPRAVLELFTSQGCSSCPPADRLMGELARDPSLITMSLAVDYWDYLGWKDTLAVHGHTNRERAYAHARGDRAVYTPQMVVNGVSAVLGSDKAAIDKAIGKTRSEAAPLTLPVTLKVADGKITADVAEARDSRKNGEVWLCPITAKVTVDVGRGENNGKQLSYYNVVRRWVKLGDWSGLAQSFSVPLSEVTGPEIDSYTVLVQSGAAARPGVMLGAATMPAR